MIAGCNNMIRVFDFEKGSLQDRDLLKCHCDSVFVLLFMANKNDFLSGSKDKSIAIWSINDENKYYCS
jgi:WD40 repeat protein